MRPSVPLKNGILAISASLSAYFAAKEASEVARIHAMLTFFASDQCLSQRLAVYFGDTQAPLTAEALTRYLCGITVPVLTHLKARSLGGFAALEHYPYAEVRRWVQQQRA